MFKPAVYHCDNCGFEEPADEETRMWVTVKWHDRGYTRDYCSPECTIPMFAIHIKDKDDD